MSVAEHLRARTLTRRWVGLGVITPFCSCSAVPAFIGLGTAGIGYQLNAAIG